MLRSDEWTNSLFNNVRSQVDLRGISCFTNAPLRCWPEEPPWIHFQLAPPQKSFRRRNSTKFSFLCNIRKLYNLQVLSQFSSWAVDESYHRSGRALSMNLKLETELCANSICNKVHWMIILQHKTAMKPSNWICMWCARWIFQVATKNFHIRFYWIV